MIITNDMTDQLIKRLKSSLLSIKLDSDIEEAFTNLHSQIKRTQEK